MGDIVTLPPRCSCAEIQGEDPQCPLHGLTIGRVAAWSDEDCLIDPEIDSFTVRRFAQEALAITRQPDGYRRGIEDAAKVAEGFIETDYRVGLDCAVTGRSRRIASAIRKLGGAE